MAIGCRMQEQDQQQEQRFELDRKKNQKIQAGRGSEDPDGGRTFAVGSDSDVKRKKRKKKRLFE